MIKSINKKKKIVFYFPDFLNAGVVKRHISLTPYFLDAGFEVIYVLDLARGPLLSSVPDGVQIIELGFSRLHQTLPALVRYLRDHPPDVLFTFHRQKNIMAIWAKLIARSKVILVSALCNPVKPPMGEDKTIANRLLPFLLRIFLRYSNHVVAVSGGIRCELKKGRYYSGDVKLIYNGIIPENFGQLISEEFDHPWLSEKKVPVYVAAGRLAPQKDFETLIRAFDLVIKTRSAKLVLFGDGPLYSELNKLAKDLGISDHVDFLGYVKNIFPVMEKASAFVLSSAFEGFPLVLIEALACGAPVISTDCPHGPSEILDKGKYGKLVEVGNYKMLADAMIEVTERHPSRDDLMKRGLEYSVARCAQEYINFFMELK